jgi:hypothetical protein
MRNVHFNPDDASIRKHVKVHVIAVVVGVEDEALVGAAVVWEQRNRAFARARR